jgi:putative acetyltransferase
MTASNHIKIIRATGQDSLTAAEIVREVYVEYGFSWDPDTYHADLYDLQAAYLDEGHAFWLAEHEGLAVGTCGLAVFPLTPGSIGSLVEFEGKPRVAGTDCSLERLYVRPSARRLGVGIALLKNAINEAKSRGLRAMEIWSDKKFMQAHALYEKLGAEIVGDRICDDPDESPEFGLILRLT